jgi:putative transposase
MVRHRFKSPGSAQRFLSAHATVYKIFNVERHFISRKSLKSLRAVATNEWRSATAA